MHVSKVYETPVDAYGDVRTLVRGLPYQCPDDWEDVLDSLDEDSNLYLVKESDNPKDKLAIAAYLDDRRVGYVAASDNGKIWLYLTDEKMPCKFIERFDASFKITFVNPRYLFEDKPFEEIYRDKAGISDRPLPAFEIPFLTNPKDKHYKWFDDKILIADLERAIPDFRRKLASRMIIIVGRKNKKAEYCYYFPYHNRPIADVEDGIIRGLIDRYGFVIALPDVPIMTNHGYGIIMDLHVTYIKKTDFKAFSFAHHSQLVFKLNRDYVDIATEDDEDEFDDESYEDNAFEEQGLAAQKYQPVKNNFKEDYALKKGESVNYHIDRDCFDEIDIITTDLYTFVRQKLFPSTELFAFLRNSTPYALQIRDFGDYETLIKVFVVKDLGRIYKMLNHSMNFDTAVGKVLFLYMGKEAGQDSDLKYEIFEVLCNRENQSSDAIKMRGTIEHFTEIFYDYDIALWTDDDFMIHSILVEVDKKLAQRYNSILNRFTSAVEKAEGNDRERGHGTSDKISSDSSLGSSSINDFFPIFGITLGETTWRQAEDLGYNVEIWKEGPGRCVDIENVTFWDHKGEGIFTSLYWVYHYCDFSPLWKSKGFSWDNSYVEWVEVFKKLGFKIEVTEEPNQKEHSGHDMLSAEFGATSSDGTLSFDLDFDYGENGCYTSSPKTLYSITVNFEGVCSQDVSHEDVEEGESYNVTDTPDGGKHVSMGVIVPEEGDEDFDFCTYECRISDKKQINIITKYMKRYEEGKESRPFLMIGRPCLGLDNIDIFYSLDGEIIFNFIFDEEIKSWIRESGFVLGKVKSYKPDALFTDQLSVTLLVSKRKNGEKLFKQASEEVMDYIEEYSSSQADHDVETRIIHSVKKYMSGDSATPYKVLIIPEYGIGSCKTLDGEDVAIIVDDEIIELAEENKGVFGYITKVDYDDDGDAWFTIRVSRSIPRLTMEQNS